MAREPKKRLIVSFIGNTDLKYLEPGQENITPILRLLIGLSGLAPRIPTNQTTLLLLDDDRPGETKREQFGAKLQADLPALGLSELQIQRTPVDLQEGPTDLHALYGAVWAAIRKAIREAGSAAEVVFHCSSGTPAMQFTLILAAQCLDLECKRVFETSRENGLREVTMPYRLAARDERARESANPKKKLPDKARKKLLPDTVVEDSGVERNYATLYKMAAQTKQPVRLIVKGPSGSGKWHACRQFAKWRGHDHPLTEWLDPPGAAAFAAPQLPPKGATLLIQHLDAWPAEALKLLTALALERPDLAIAATFRNDRRLAVPLESVLSEGLLDAVHLDLPSLGARCDVVELGKALARQQGIPDGKIRERLGYYLLTDLYPRNLHDLKACVGATAASSPGIHPEQSEYRNLRQKQDSEAKLKEACEVLSTLNFGPGRKLETILDTVQRAIVDLLLAKGKKQSAVADILGCSQQTVSRILNNK